MTGDWGHYSTLSIIIVVNRLFGLWSLKCTVPSSSAWPLVPFADVNSIGLVSGLRDLNHLISLKVGVEQPESSMTVSFVMRFAFRACWTSSLASDRGLLENPH